ncbi:AaceriAGR386Cp [[Ashbya] aceris (nom. inval.)]|nr:AaceriAGR386Cp [[Ashbya] aceris (nom. inval.)]
MSESSYIITLKKGADLSKVRESIEQIGGSILHEHSLINGLSVKLPEVTALEQIKSQHDDLIQHIERDQEVHILDN